MLEWSGAGQTFRNVSKDLLLGQGVDALATATNWLSGFVPTGETPTGGGDFLDAGTSGMINFGKFIGKVMEAQKAKPSVKTSSNAVRQSPKISWSKRQKRKLVNWLFRTLLQ